MPKTSCQKICQCNLHFNFFASKRLYTYIYFQFLRMPFIHFTLDSKEVIFLVRNVNIVNRKIIWIFWCVENVCFFKKHFLMNFSIQKWTPPSPLRLYFTRIRSTMFLSFYICHENSACIKWAKLANFLQLFLTVTMIKNNKWDM